MKKLICLITMILISQLCFALEDYYTFESPEKQQRFENLTSQLRCLVCQNQTLAESNAPLAADLRQQIYHKVNANQSEQDIIQYLVKRYGDYILYRPPLNTKTVGLWLGPFLLLGLGIFYLLYYLFKRRS